jgi:O-antigen/teichoic acid export membrane protein
MPSSNEFNRFFRHSAIYAVGSALNRVGAFLLLPLYTRYLSTEQYGTLEIFYAILAMVSGVLSVGIAHATLRFYFDYTEEDDRKAVVSTNLVASFAITLVGALLVWGFGDLLVTALLGHAGPPWAFELILATMVLELSSQVALAFLRAREESVFFISVSFAKLLVQCVANFILLVKFDAGIVGVLFGNFLAVALGWVVVGGHTVRHCGLRFQKSKFLPVMHYSLPFLYITIIAALFSNLDRFLINMFDSLAAVGVYSLATKFSKLISDLIGEPFNRAYGSFRFSVMGRPDAADVQASILRYMAALLAVISVAIVYFTGDVLRLMSAEAFWPAAALMPMLVVAASLQLLSYILQTGILYQKRTEQLVRITVTRTGVGLVTAPVLIYAFDAQGACAAALIDAVLTVVLTHRISQRYFPVQYDMPRLARLTALVVVAYLIALPVAALAPWPAFACKAALWLCFIAAVLAAGILTQDERAWIKARLMPRPVMKSAD